MNRGYELKRYMERPDGPYEDHKLTLVVDGIDLLIVDCRASVKQMRRVLRACRKGEGKWTLTRRTVTEVVEVIE